MRIISICPSNTELLGYLGLTSQIVAVDDYSDWPKEVHNLPRLGPDLDIDMDKLESLQPDLVVASLSVPGMEKNVEALKERNIPHVVFNPNSLDEIAANLLELGKMTNSENKAKQVAARYNEIIEQYRDIAKSVAPTSLYWEWWPKPIFTPGESNWLTIISELAGGTNIYSDHQQASVQTNWEDVRKRNPDHICLVWVGVQQEKVKPELVKQRPGWTELQAIKDNKIYVLDEPLFCRPSPKLITGLTKIASIIHPNAYPAFDGEDPLL
ncbi:cobalamin-binding protein [Anaerobacillus sp. MEB173]|uniref:cobalamin-binding protein n=1 Tax=Anaerobacillus sp. MEB173 TaxID=3383345 RepID=UPI003F92990A